MLGAFTGIALTWLASGTNACSSTTMVTTARNFVSGGQVIFSTEFPSGAEGTSLVKHLGASRNEVIANWPAFSFTKLRSTLSWEGSFVSPNLRGGSRGPAGGPTVFYDAADEAL